MVILAISKNCVLGEVFTIIETIKKVIIFVSENKSKWEFPYMFEQ